MARNAYQVASDRTQVQHAADNAVATAKKTLTLNPEKFTPADKTSMLRESARYLNDLAEKIDAKGQRICGSKNDQPESKMVSWLTAAANRAPSLTATKHDATPATPATPATVAK